MGKLEKDGVLEIAQYIRGSVATFQDYAFDASGTAFPTNPVKGGIYIVGTGGTINSVAYGAGDVLVYSGDTTLGNLGFILMEDASDT